MTLSAFLTLFLLAGLVVFNGLVDGLYHLPLYLALAQALMSGTIGWLVWIRRNA